MRDGTKTALDSRQLGLALINTARAGDVEACSAIISQGADVNWSVGRDIPALLCAAQNGNVPLARLLIDAGADIDIADNSGARALTWAIVSKVGDEIVKVLLEAGADPNFSNLGWQGSPLNLAISDKNLSLVRLLVEHGAKMTYVPDRNAPGALCALQYAVWFGHIDVVRHFMEACDEDFKQVTWDGRTLFDLAKGRPAMLQLLHAWATGVAVRAQIDTQVSDEVVHRLPSIGRGPL